MENIKTNLSDLFKCWKNAHLNEDDTSLITTCPNLSNIYGLNLENFKESFVADGCVNYNEYGNSEKRVLFIMKEAAILDKDRNKPRTEDIKDQMDKHWFKRVMGNGGESKRYYKKFSKILEVLGIGCESAAMMNINKRGGLCSGTDDNKLAAYIGRYKEKYIEKQIEILNPTLIVSFIGRNSAAEALYDKSKTCTIEYGNNSEKKAYCYTAYFNDIPVFGMWHPAYMCSYKDYETVFSKLYDSIK